MTPRQIHHLDTTAVYALLGSRPAGLAPDEIARRTAELGPNTLAPPRSLRWLTTLGAQFGNLFSVLLDVSAALCFVAERMRPGQGMAVLGWALLTLAVLNALFTFAQAMRAERAMEALRRLLPQEIRVRRWGREDVVAASTLVPGDVLLLAECDRVPADARLVEAHDLLVNTAPLTGEARPLGLTAVPVAGGRLVDSPNLVFAAAGAPAAASGQAAVQDNESQKDIVKIAVGSPDHSTLVAALKAADLVDVLANPGPFTAFAPVNAAFDKLPPGTVDDLRKPANKAKLAGILRHHVTTSAWDIADLSDGLTLSMADGGSATISRKGEDVFIDGAKIVASVRASNGMVHVVDGIVLPK